MTEEKRLAKNNRIREKGKETRLRRQSQICRVFRVKIDFSHLNEFEKSQQLDISQIECNNCRNIKSKTFENLFYRCNICKINLLRQFLRHL